MRNGLIIEEEFQTQLISTLTLDMGSFLLHLLVLLGCSEGGLLTGADSATITSLFLPPAAIKK